MGKVKYLIVVALFFSGFIANAQSAAQSLLTRDLLVSAKTLKTEKSIYNYFTMPKGNPELNSIQGRQAFVNRYLSSRAGDFWRMDFTETSKSVNAAGPGLYFAIDPLISETFGDSFIEVRMPAGTRFINVVAPIPLKKDTLAALIGEGFIQQDQIPTLFPKDTGFYRDTLRMIVDPQFVNFRKLVQAIFTANQLRFVEYNFNTSLGNFCPGHSYSAFLFVGDLNSSNPRSAIVPVDFQSTMVFSTKIEIPNLTDAEMARKAEILKFKSTLEQIQDKSTADSKKIISSNYSPDEFQAVKDETYSCQ
jgi:hypothetical protein